MKPASFPYRILELDDPQGWRELPPGKPQVLVLGMALTFDPAGGVGLLEIDPEKIRSSVRVGSQEVIDVAHVNPGEKIVHDGRSWLIARQMDVIVPEPKERLDAAFRRAALLGARDLTAIASEPVARRQEREPAPTMRRSTRVLGIIGVAAAAFGGALWLMPPKDEPDAELIAAKPAPQQTSVAPAPATEARPEARVSETKVDEGSKDEAVAQARDPSLSVVAASEPEPVTEAPKAEEVKPEPTMAVQPAPAKPRQNVAKTSPRKRAPSLSPKERARLESMIEEAVLLSGYDGERAKAQLEALRSKIPEGTDLRNTLEAEIRKL